VRLLEECFASDMVELRMKAAIDAASCQSLKVASLLEQQLEQEPSADVRAVLIKSLAVCAQGERLTAIIKAASAEEDTVRAAAIEVLALFTDKPNVLNTIIQCLQDDSEQVRTNAREALHKVDPERLSQAIRLMLQHPKPDYRCCALFVLERSYDARVFLSTWAGRQARPKFPPLEGFPDKDALRLIKILVSDPNPQVSQRARGVLPHMATAGIIGAREVLLDLKAKEPEEEKQREGVGLERHLSAARNKLNHPDPDVRMARIRKICQESDKSLLPLFRDRCNVEQDQLVLRYLIEGLAELGGAGERQLISGYLSYNNLAVRLAAVEALGDFGDPESLTKLHPLLEENNLRLRSTVACILCKTGQLDTAEYLSSLVDIGGRDELLAALMVIRHLPKAADYHDLLERIHDMTDDRKVKTYAQEAETVLRKVGVIKEQKVTGRFKWSLDSLSKPEDKGGIPERTKIMVGVLFAVVLLTLILVFL